MNRTEFIRELRAMADNLEKGHFYTIDIDENTIVANRNYGEVWLRFNKGLTMNIHLFSATDYERKEFVN